MNPRNSGRKRNLQVVDPRHPEQNQHKEELKESLKKIPKIPEAPPRYMMKDAKELWRILVPKLNKVGLVTSLDQTNLELFCTSYAEYRDGIRAVKRYGSVYMDDNGKLNKNPGVNIIDTASKTMRQLGVTLGIDFNSHSQSISVKGDSKDDSIDLKSAMKMFGGG